jgi:lysophospholipase L1-like esterase
MPVKGDILFTGSSSIRLWENLPSYFPTHQIIQRGFGGSHFSDLIYYIDKLVIKYRPSKVFIYEGDNDLYDDKSVSRVIKDAKRTIQLIHIEIPELPIYFISPKPSIARVSHQDKYLKFNKKLKSYCDKNDLLFFIDVWTPMFDESGNLIEGIFIEDGLHMNKKGYQIWQKIIAPYL